ncbi:hypothetical protein F2Q69_00030044 [Brassica cretica]|uniref:Alpha-galactosidase n=1 Tax=Brassica cretica TaxID=69181 RepID=A0A8S9S7Z4_BRACR|nr:hypothetical protein F2Q69_00030044 [Brassica cretica]
MPSPVPDDVPPTSAAGVHPHFLVPPGMKMEDHVLFFVVLFSLSVQTIGGRVKAPPLLQKSNTNGLVFSKSFNSIYDTSMYSRLQLNNGLTLTPQMADALVSSGLADLGYIHVNIDDCWSNLLRDSKGQLVPHPETFPQGIKLLADIVHSKGWFLLSIDANNAVKVMLEVGGR